MNEKELKAILDPEFSIDDEIAVSHGGKGVKKNTRLSFRYFLMMNTLSKDIVDNGKMFFDKMTIERYRDVWPQIFDLSFSVITPESLAVQKQINELGQEIESLEQSKRKAEKQILSYNQQILILIKKAKEAGLIDEGLSDEQSIDKLREIIEHGITHLITNYSTEQKYEKLQAKRDDVSLRLTKLKRFKQSYSAYRNRLKSEQDALSPITYIQSKFSDRTQGEYRQFLNNLATEFVRINAAISEKRPFELDVDRQIRQLTAELKDLDASLALMPKVDYKVIPTAQKLVSLGELRANYKHITPCSEDTDVT